MEPVEKTYTLYGGPLHLETRKIPSLPTLSNIYRSSTSLIPVNEYFRFSYFERDSNSFNFTDEGKIQLPPADFNHKEAVYRVKQIQGEHQKIFPVIVYSEWTLNDALDFIFNGTKKV